MPEKFIDLQAASSSSAFELHQGQWPPGRPTVVHCFQKLANPIDTIRGTTNLDDEWIYEYCTTQEHSQTPHSSASNIAGTITVAIVPMPIYTTTFVRTSIRVSTPTSGSQK